MKSPLDEHESSWFMFIGHLRICVFLCTLSNAEHPCAISETLMSTGEKRSSDEQNILDTVDLFQHFCWCKKFVQILSAVCSVAMLHQHMMHLSQNHGTRLSAFTHLSTCLVISLLLLQLYFGYILERIIGNPCVPHWMSLKMKAAFKSRI